jgi:CheY-like chemotaxis protein
MASIVIIDDDLAMDLLAEHLRFHGHKTLRMESTTDAIQNSEAIAVADLVILDIIMPWPECRDARSLSGNNTAGMEVWTELRKRRKDLPIIVYSATQDAAIIAALEDDECSRFVPKWSSPSMKEFVRIIHGILGLTNEHPQPQAFIVHGHNETLKLSLKNYLQNTLRLPEPIILHEQPSVGRALMEKFEDYAAIAAIVFVLLTPDDQMAGAHQTDDEKRRARQNVIFEMGYFLGTLGRKSGRVVLLHQAPLELPSDISGLEYIDISQGIEAAGEKIRREIGYVKC